MGGLRGRAFGVAITIWLLSQPGDNRYGGLAIFVTAMGMLPTLLAFLLLEAANVFVIPICLRKNPSLPPRERRSQILRLVFAAALEPLILLNARPQEPRERIRDFLYREYSKSSIERLLQLFSFITQNDRKKRL